MNHRLRAGRVEQNMRARALTGGDMRIVRHLVVAAMLAGLAGVTSAAVELNKDYKALPAAQPTEAAGKATQSGRASCRERV